MNGRVQLLLKQKGKSQNNDVVSMMYVKICIYVYIYLFL